MAFTPINFAQELILATLDKPMTTAALKLAWPELCGICRQLRGLEELQMIEGHRSEQMTLFGRAAPVWTRRRRGRTLSEIEQASFSRFNSQPRGGAR